ncbi:MAG: hypothetical protein M3Y87_13445 [Myxococcota bacterium]|nr:hypothetical protein [Myxococcota bacterium]
MVKRLLIGLIKGLVIGGAIGAGIQYGLHWTVTSGGLLGYLFAMGAAGSTGVFAGKPPWRTGAWVEALLKGAFGIGVGALAYWLGATYGAFSLPFPGIEEALPWTALPVVYLPAIAGVYGSLVELDNTGDDKKSGGGKTTTGPKARVAVDDDDAFADTEQAGRTRAGRRQKA